MLRVMKSCGCANQRCPDCSDCPDCLCVMPLQARIALNGSGTSVWTARALLCQECVDCEGLTVPRVCGLRGPLCHECVDLEGLCAIPLASASAHSMRTRAQPSCLARLSLELKGLSAPDLRTLLVLPRSSCLLDLIVADCLPALTFVSGSSLDAIFTL